MKFSKKLVFINSRNFKTLNNEKLDNKIVNNKSNIFSKKKFYANNVSAKNLGNQNDLLFKRNINNIIINNSINNVINKLEVVSRNYYNNSNLEYFTLNSSFRSNINNNYFPTRKNIKSNLSSIIKGKNILSKRTSKNYSIDSLYFNSSINKIRKNPSFYMSRITNAYIMSTKNNHMKNYSNLISNNISLYNNSINSPINKSIRNHTNILSYHNKLESFLKNKYSYIRKYQVKKNGLNKKIQKAVLKMNKILPIRIKFNYIINKKKLNLKNFNINKPNYLSKNKNKTLANMLSKNLKKYNTNLINNNCKNSIDNNYLVHKYNNYFGEENYLKTIFKDEKNQHNIEIIKHNKQNKNIVEKNKKIEFKEAVSKRENDKNYYSNLSKTFEYSNNSTKSKDEGIFEIDEIRDLIIYYDLNKELNKVYLFEKFDYNIFIKKKMKKYVLFFMK